MALAALKRPPIQPFDYERRVLHRWNKDCEHGDRREVNRDCGLTPEGSPPNTMDSIYVMGERQEEDVTGYADPPPPPRDEDIDACHAYMDALRILRPAVHEALTARHRRLVHGEYQVTRSDVGIAMALYGLSRSASMARLTKECDAGYAGLREWLTRKRR